MSKLKATIIENTEWADGDSFKVMHRENDTANAIEATVRLYFVDCPETVAKGENDAQRLRTQARYFGVDSAELVIKAGELATKRTQELLKKPFTLHTAFSNALGRSRKSRIYGMITLHDGRDLAAVLVEEGLARAYGQRHQMPDGTHSKDYMEKLSDLELVAAIKKKGIWAHSDPVKLVAMRAEARKEEADLRKFTRGGSFSAVTEENPVNINTASKKELQLLHGIGKGLSDEIIKSRPYKKVEDLYLVKGLGETTVNRLRPFLTVKALKKVSPQ